jgi:hypothetical protein
MIDQLLTTQQMTTNALLTGEIENPENRELKTEN